MKPTKVYAGDKGYKYVFVDEVENSDSFREWLCGSEFKVKGRDAAYYEDYRRWKDGKEKE